jgi:2-iminoacetate synthase
MSFFDTLSQLNIEATCKSLESISEEDVLRTLQKSTFTLADLPTLISKAATPHIEKMAQKAHSITKQRFGNTMQLFIPMYLSNLCFNKCTYCGFSVEHKYPRTTLTEEEILAEAKLIQDKGFQHLLLLTGEAQGVVDVEYISKAVAQVKPLFASIGIEIQPLNEAEYIQMIEAGADSLTLYQETYHQGAYAQYHLAGKKKNFKHRLDAAEAGGRAGFYRINIGALIGLYEWQYEAIALANHLSYMQKKYWKSKYSISFPRIQKMVGQFNPKYIISNSEFVQLICAFRLIFPDIGITLSTRESAELRDQLIPLGITTMSAESKTEPGGYSGKTAEKQFETSDNRSLDEIKTLLIKKGYDPVLKDWH